MRYKWQTGMLAWVLHRLTGLALTLYLVLHIWSIHSISKGEEGFNAVMKLYELPIFKLGEIGLLACVIYHALNGLRVFAVDYFGCTKNQKQVFVATVVVGAVLFIAGAVPIFSHILK